MHILSTKIGELAPIDEAIDLDLPSADILFLSYATSELNLISEAHKHMCEAYQEEIVPSLNAVNISYLSHNMSVDLFVEKSVKFSKIIIIRLLGGRSYWPYGIDEIVKTSVEQYIKLIILPGDEGKDLELEAMSNISNHKLCDIKDYFNYGGLRNFIELFKCFTAELGFEHKYMAAEPISKYGIYYGGRIDDEQEFISKLNKLKSCVYLIFYRALFVSDDLEVIDSLCKKLEGEDLNIIPIFIDSLKAKATQNFIDNIYNKFPAQLILNLTSFSVSNIGDKDRIYDSDNGGNKGLSSNLDSHIENNILDYECPILQLILSSSDIDYWQDNLRGLMAKELAMNVALPEVDGRIITRAISFKKLDDLFDNENESLNINPIIKNHPYEERVDFVIRLTKAYLELANNQNSEKNIAIILANYPIKDGRIGNGVGLDVPQSVVDFLKVLDVEGYDLGEVYPKSPKELLDKILDGPTNNLAKNKDKIEQFFENLSSDFITLPLAEYLEFTANIHPKTLADINSKWGKPQDSLHFHDGRFILSILKFGNIIIGLQPARGYEVDMYKSYHDPDLIPPHSYLAFYAYLRNIFKANAVINFGKHGNLEWLPGKSVALSQKCYPDMILDALPNFYPFIVNDPGEGTQAKRRSQATIIDHLTPPLMRADNYDELLQVENLLDEYYQAFDFDPKRALKIKDKLVKLCRRINLDKDLGLVDAGLKSDDDGERLLTKVDSYLCELKELQIRNGLHIFGSKPNDDDLAQFIISLIRLPRFDGVGKNQSILMALIKDLGISNFDPFSCEMNRPYKGERPQILAEISSEHWRSYGDTLERLEILALYLFKNPDRLGDGFENTNKVFGFVDGFIKPAISKSVRDEFLSLLKGLDGKFVKPGPSGAPSRGRLDVLPTGRNFYSVDCRAIPTETSYDIGFRSAQNLLERHFQDHGEFPEKIAMSAWSTSNMRTGGDDISQALALIGAKPKWNRITGRIEGFEIIPLAQLNRPRIDVIFRISGMFRDAFPIQISLLSSAIRKVANLEDEEIEDNYVRANYLKALKDHKNKNHLNAEDDDLILARIFGSKPGSYGAGMQTLIDSGNWQGDEDFAKTYIKWGGYYYDEKSFGDNAEEALVEHLRGVKVVIHNQDNREHDILDSDDYYQFQGGLAATVRHINKSQPIIYHNDHSNPEALKTRSLYEEISRVVRARAANPKWIKSVMKHGYKGAFEIAATVDYLFAYAVTSRQVDHHHFEQLFNAYIQDDEVREFLDEFNNNALKEMVERFEEAIERKLWQPKSNRVHAIIEDILKRV